MDRVSELFWSAVGRFVDFFETIATEFIVGVYVVLAVLIVFLVGAAAVREIHSHAHVVFWVLVTLVLLWLFGAVVESVREIRAEEKRVYVTAYQ